MIKGLKKALKGRVIIGLIKNPNKNAFGIEKNGIPNRQVVLELTKVGANIR